MATSTVSHHVFRRRARAMERFLERERINQIAMTPVLSVRKELNNTSYRVAKRNGGLRWAVEKITR